MPYQSDTIAVVVSRLNSRYFLPAIQREFVWRPDQIVQLFDSLLRGYPISTFLFWDLNPENRDRWDIYRFIDNFHANETHNDLATTTGLQQVTLVLDGQQRLTSLLIGLKGSYTLKKKYKRWDSPDAWVKHHLYLDLFKDPNVEQDDGDLGIRYGLEFFPQAPPGDGHRFWFRVGRIMDFDSEDRFQQFKYEERDKLPDETTKKQQRLFEQNLERLYRVVWKNDAISYYTELDQDYDRVLDIFVRANEGGTKLSKSDLLLSMVTSQWDGVNAREEIYGFVGRLNNDLARKNDFDKDFIMKTCLVLADLPVQYKVNNFNNQNLARIQDLWSEMKKAVEGAVNLVNWFGIDRDTLTSANALIPIIYYFLKHPTVTLRGSTPLDVRNASAVRRWLSMVLLNNAFGGQSDNVLRDTRRVLQERAAGVDFPAEALSAVLAQSGRPARFDDTAIDNFLEITYGKQTTFLALSLLYDDNSWGVSPHQQDHIFPKSLLQPRRLERAGIPSEKHDRYQELVNRLANLQLLLAHENQEKSDQDFFDWLSTRDPSFRQRHLIPQDDEVLRLEKFEEFIVARESLIRERLRKLFPPIPVSASTRPPDGPSVSEPYAMDQTQTETDAESLKYCDERCRELASAALRVHRPAVIGFELQDEKGRVCAEAELAWPSCHIAVLLPEQAKSQSLFQERGWKVFTIGEAGVPVTPVLDLLKE